MWRETGAPVPCLSLCASVTPSVRLWLLHSCGRSVVIGGAQRSLCGAGAEEEACACGRAGLSAPESWRARVRVARGRPAHRHPHIHASVCDSALINHPHPLPLPPFPYLRTGIRISVVAPRRCSPHRQPCNHARIQFLSLPLSWSAWPHRRPSLPALPLSVSLFTRVPRRKSI